MVKRVRSAAGSDYGQFILEVDSASCWCSNGWGFTATLLCGYYLDSLITSDPAAAVSSPEPETRLLL